MSNEENDNLHQIKNLERLGCSFIYRKTEVRTRVSRKDQREYNIYIIYLSPSVNPSVTLTTYVYKDSWESLSLLMEVYPDHLINVAWQIDLRKAIWSLGPKKE